MDGRELFGAEGIYASEAYMGRDFEQDLEQVRQRLEQKYPEVRRLAKLKKAEIYWGD